MMKKILLLFAVCGLFFCCLSGCADSTASVGKNRIAPAALSDEQKEIVDLLSSTDQEILLFDFQSEEAYKSREFWVEAYENGELKDRLSGVSYFADEAKPLNGKLAVVINHSEVGVSWKFMASEDGTRVSNSNAPAEVKIESLGRGFGPITEPVDVVAGKEIVLYSSIYTDGSFTDYSDLQRYREEPELLRGYPYAFLIVCKFE
jgi:hypothetical protein